MSAVQAILSSSSSLAVFLSVLFLVLSSYELNPINAFMLLSFMNLLKTHFSIYLGKGLQMVFEAIVSLRRIEELLLLNELRLSREGLNASLSGPEDDTALSNDDPISNAFRRERKQPFHRKDDENKEPTKNNPTAEDKEGRCLLNMIKMHWSFQI